MATPLLIENDQAGNRVNLSDCARKFSDTAIIFTLVAGVTVNVTVPSTSNFPANGKPTTALLMLVSKSPDATVLVQPSASPVLAAPTIVPTATTAEVNPIGFRQVNIGQTLQFFTSDANVTVGLEFYSYAPG